MLVFPEIYKGFIVEKAKVILEKSRHWLHLVGAIPQFL